MQETIGVQHLQDGPYPDTDGWGWLYRCFERIAPQNHGRRRGICRYFYPGPAERWRGGLVYKLLGVPWFGRMIPTGGIAVRRATRSRMRPYTLSGNSLSAAKAFYYRACVFEALHLPFLVTLLLLAVYRATQGRLDLALEDTAVNLAINVYPMMHHRRTRLRIVQLLDRNLARRARRRRQDD